MATGIGPCANCGGAVYYRQVGRGPSVEWLISCLRCRATIPAPRRTRQKAVRAWQAVQAARMLEGPPRWPGLAPQVITLTPDMARRLVKEVTLGINYRAGPTRRTP